MVMSSPVARSSAAAPRTRPSATHMRITATLLRRRIASIGPDLAPQRAGNGWTGAQEVDVAASLAAMTGRRDLLDVAVLPRPACPPPVHFEDPLGSALAQHRRQRLVTESPPCRDRVLEMKGPVVRLLVADRGSDRHLRHDGGAAPADKALVHEQHTAPFTRRRNRRIHAGAARTDYEDVGRKVRQRPSGSAVRSCACHQARYSTSRSTM